MRNYEVYSIVPNMLCLRELFRIICICFISELHIENPALLADAKMPKYIPQHLIRRNLSYDIR